MVLKLLGGYGFGFYRYGVWFGFGQIQLRRWGFDLCFLKKRIDGELYNRFWFSTPLRDPGTVRLTGTRVKLGRR